MGSATSAISPVHPDLEWAASGAMALTGCVDGPPELAPAPIATAACAAVSALASVASASPTLDTRALRALDAAALLGERAAIFGHTRHGSTSAGETCHLLRCADGWTAVNLARPEDMGLLPAWLGEARFDDPHAFVAGNTSRRNAADIVERGRLLGLPVAPVAGAPAARATDWLRVAAEGAPRRGAPVEPPLVVDLSALWAGPLCTHLLALAGARVVKLESTRRPDGARRGPSAFFDLINGGKRSVALDFASNDGVRALRALVNSADIVVESSRPRALRQLGINAEDIVAMRPGRVWVSITGYGRDEPMGNWVAFGDDAAVAGGLVAWPAGTDGTPIFCADAVADPLTAMHAALAALSHWQRGGGALLDVALQRVAAFVAAQPVTLPRGRVDACRHEGAIRDWEVVVADERCAVAAPRARPVTTRAC
ncbi:MAG TPA: CoA transferase, partial [Candidatus Binatia bacterium]|nr:CoA transferase [Candidatus Binatia bacterium]